MIKASIFCRLIQLTIITWSMLVAHVYPAHYTHSYQLNPILRFPIIAFLSSVDTESPPRARLDFPTNRVRKSSEALQQSVFIAYFTTAAVSLFWGAIFRHAVAPTILPPLGSFWSPRASYGVRRSSCANNSLRSIPRFSFMVTFSPTGATVSSTRYKYPP
jgi:hypothetical protein